jgi:hypothetical protein
VLWKENELCEAGVADLRGDFQVVCDAGAGISRGPVQKTGVGAGIAVFAD